MTPPYLEAPNALVPLKFLAVLEPLERGAGIPVRLASELNGLAGRHGVQLLLHLLRLGPLWGHG